MPWSVTPLKDREERLRAGMATGLNLKTTPGRMSNLGVVSAEVAAEVDGTHQHIAYQAKQIHAATADADNLAVKAQAVGLQRNPAVSAQGQVTFTGTDAVTVPAGTIIRYGDGREYTTNADVMIAAGTAVADVAALVPGTAGNLAEGETLALVQTIEGIAGQANVTSEITGGIDLEDLEAFRKRVLFRQQHPAQGGNDADYAVWASAVSGVGAVWVAAKEMGLGTVTVRIAADDSAGSPIPTETLRQSVEDRINGYINPVTNQWEGRPGGMEVYIVAVAGNTLDLVFAELTPNDAATLTAIADSVNAMLIERRKPGGTIRLDWISEAISKATGEDRHKLLSPVADFVCATNEIAVLGVITPPGA